MNNVINMLGNLLPAYLTSEQKERISEAFSQFESEGEINYEQFYCEFPNDFLMQADVLHSAPAYEFHDDDQLESFYTPVMLISNTCDVDLSNKRLGNHKNALVAPIISLPDYKESFFNCGGTEAQFKVFRDALLRQRLTNLLYLPGHSGGEELIVRLDQIFWVSLNYIRKVSSDISSGRARSLSNWAHYLFLVKVSYHFCRVPEEIQRKN